MASPPPPSYSGSMSTQKKRPSMSSSVSFSNKRQKTHPLRQASFPVDSDAQLYGSAVGSARSETGSVAASSTTGKQQPRGRGRPRKSVQVSESDVKAAQERGAGDGKGAHAKSVISTAKSATGAHEEEQEEDEDDEPDIVENEGEENEQRREDERINIFVGQLTKEQSERYNAFRSSSLKNSVVKRIVNQTVSQSVTSSAIQAVQYFSKAFAIELIERAREVQTEWAAAAQVNLDKDKAHAKQTWLDKQAEFDAKEKAANEKEPPEPLTEQEKRVWQLEIRALKDAAEKYLPNKHRAGLLPDHLREALRRYKSDGDGSGFGFDGMSHPLLGVHGSAAWRLGDGATGQRLFR